MDVFRGFPVLHRVPLQPKSAPLFLIYNLQVINGAVITGKRIESQLASGSWGQGGGSKLRVYVRVVGRYLSGVFSVES